MNFKLKISNLKFIGIFVYLFICLFVHSGNVYAQQVTLSIDPPIVQAKIKPGKSILVAYTVENKGDPTNLQFLIRPFVPVGQNGSLTLIPQLEGPVQFNLENADVLFEKPFFFASKEKRQAVVRIHIPLGIPDGDYYYMIIAETVPAFSLAGQSTGVASASLGAPLLISVTESGITEIQAQIAELSFKPNTVISLGKQKFTIVDSADTVSITGSVRNMGKHMVQPNGTITHRSGNLKKNYAIIPQNILSNSQRILKTDGGATGTSDATVTLSHLTIGKHIVTAAVSFNEDSSVHYKSIEFIALPIRFLRIVIVVFGLVILYFLFRKGNKNTHTR